MALTRVRGEGVGTLSGDTTTVTLEDTSSHSANTGPAISFKSKDSGGTTREVAKVIGESHSGTDEGNLALQTRNGGTLETKWKVFKNGNLIPSNSAYGIILGNTVTGDANLLDDYEEGTFSASHAGYQISTTGAYTKIGRMVHFAIDLTAHSGASSNLHFFYGLPFTASGKDCGVAMGYASGSDIPRAYVEQGTDRVYLRNSDGTGNANLGAGTRVGVAGTYAT